MTIASRRIAWVVWLIASIFYAYQYILRVMPNIMLDDIMLRFNVGAAAFGQFSGIYYIGYTLLHMPIGLMLDRFGPRKVMSGCILFTTLGLLPLIMAENWAYPVLGRLLIGLGSSAAILGVFKIVRVAFSEKLFPRMLSFSVTIGLIGAIYGGGPLSYMHERMGYQAVVQLFALIGVGLAVATYFIVPNIKLASEGTIFSNIKEVFSNRRVIFASLFAGFMVGPLEGFADVWGKAYLKTLYGFENNMAASFSSLIFMGMCFGAPVLGFIAEKSRSYLAVVVGSGIAMSAAFIVLMNWQVPLAVLAILFVLVGVCSAYQVLTIYYTSICVREQVAGLTTAVANMIVMIFGYAFHSIMGVVINAFGGAGEPSALSYGVSVIPLGLCVGTVGFIYLLLQETRRKVEA